MDLTQNRKALGGAGVAIAFGLLVAWMMPPTQPHMGATNWRANIKPTTPPAPVDFAGLAPATAAVPGSPVEQVADGGDGAPGVEPAANRVTVYRAQPTRQEADLAADDEPDGRDDGVRASPLPGYRDGYRWAQSRDADPRDCRDAPTAAAADGCLAYAYSYSRGSSPMDDDPEEPQGPDF